MKNRKTFPILFAIAFIAALVFITFFIPKHKKTIHDLSQYVNPILGTGGHGHTYPGASMPFGMVQLSPDSRLTGWDGCSAYHYSDSIIYGFSHTHLSGTGVSDYGDILFMPMSGKYSYDSGYFSDELGYASVFNHNTEIALPGYYAVHLETPNVDVELTVTERTGVHKYRYNNNDTAYMMIDLTHRDDVIESGFKQVNETDISGFRRSRAWAKDQHVYFYARFSEPINSTFYKINDADINDKFDAYGKGVKIIAGFNNLNDKELIVKVGISAVSIEGAKQNLEQETDKFDFESIKSRAKSAWNDELSDIVVRGDEYKKRVFYSALYHAYLAPNLFTDVDGKYRGTDLKIHQAKDHTQYTVFSLWDTYRATHPLFTITQTKRTNDFIQTFLNQYEQGGQLPVWELAGNFTGCMIGYHSIPVIADAYAKGIDNFDAELALEAMQHSATMEHLGLPAFISKGYIGVEDEHESVSKALEYAYDDWCIAQMAKKMGKDNVYKTFIQRAQYYKNHFDHDTKLMRARVNGSWFSPFDPAEVNFNYTEANAWQYSFYVPQDIHGWMDMLGGPNAMDALLDSLFVADNETSGRHQVDITGLIGQYAHGNEPSHHIAYMYNYCGKPWKSQALVKKIMNEMYSDQPDGYIGNEDCGQMSAWYVFSALGFYPVNPASGIYDFGSPMFDTAIIQLENGKQFEITAENLSDENVYIQSVEINEKSWNKTYIRHEQIMNGGKLHFVMGAAPNKDFGSNEEAIFSSRITDEPIIISPIMTPAQRSFSDSLIIEIHTPQADDVMLFYTTDGSMPNQNSRVYSEPIRIYDDAEIQCIAMQGEKQSGIVVGKYKKIDDRVSIELFAEYSNQYNAGGNTALIDGIRGGNDFRTGEWQGYDAQDLIAIVDLGREMEISSVYVGFLQDIKSWIWMPTAVEFSIANQSKQFKTVGTINSEFNDDNYGAFVEDIEVDFTPQLVRHIKIEAKTYGDIPEWHLGYGGESWIFADEIYWK
ncbi:MAG: GH92 family glycosyl hydrolase [Bacteroidota bacterium]|nr:GH92 family glycosyl hydrolase [Bacteroidota bacterium]